MDTPQEWRTGYYVLPLVGLLGLVVVLVLVSHRQHGEGAYACRMTLPAEDGSRMTQETILVTLPCVVTPADGEHLNHVVGGVYVVSRPTYFLRIPAPEDASRLSGWHSLEKR